MYLAPPPTELPPRDRPVIPAFVRTHSTLRASLAVTSGRTAAARIHEAGALRLRFPRTGGACEGIILNTSGGIAGGDRQSIDISLGAGATAALTTQSAEKVYRSDGEIATIVTALELGAQANFAWLPQDTILFDTARLSRRIEVQLPTSATFTIKEGVVFGRTAMNEQFVRGFFHDRWRIKRDGQLVLAEDVRLDGDVAATLARPALGNGLRAVATLVHVAPDAATKLDDVRHVTDNAACEAGASAWNGMLVVRLAGPVPHVVRAASANIVRLLLPGVNPRVWSC